MTDVRHAELGAMIDAFLGADYDPARRQQIDAIQQTLDKEHAELSRRRIRGEVTDEQFVNQANSLIDNAFEKCEQVLGKDDFQRLFGEPAHEATALIDKATFLSRSSERESLQGPAAIQINEIGASTIYSNFVEIKLTAEEMVLSFGLNTQAQIIKPIQTTHRVVMNFYTGKRLLHLLGQVIAQHEATFGVLELDAQRRARMAQSRSGAGALTVARP